MIPKQLKKSGHYSTSFFAALRTTFCVRTDYQNDSLSRVRFFESALFLPIIGLMCGLLLMVIGMVGSYVFQSNVVASALVVCAFIGLFRGFFASDHAKISWFDAALLIVFFSLAYTSFERHIYLPLMLSVGVGGLTTVFAAGLGRDVPMAPRRKQLCGLYQNEDYFYIVFLGIAFAIATIVVLHETWYVGLPVILAIAACVPHFIARSNGGVTFKGISRGILLATIITFAFLLIY